MTIVSMSLDPQTLRKLEEVVKKLVHKHCGRDLVPSDLRSRVLTRIQEVRMELEVTEFRVD